MLGATLSSLDQEISGQCTYNDKDRGWAGKVIHRWFVDDDNRSEPDLRDVNHPTLDHVGLEIKAVPLDLGARGQWRVIYPMSLTMINFSDIHQQEDIRPIQESALFSKDRWTLAVYYSHEKENQAQGRILGLGIWDLEKFGFETIYFDYYRGCNFVKRGMAASLSETQFHTLSARRKGGAGQMRGAGPPGKVAKTRVWALKAHYVRKRLELDGLDGCLELDGVDDESSKRQLDSISNSYSHGVQPLPPKDSEAESLLVFIRDVLTGKTAKAVAKWLGYDRFGGKDVHSRIARKALHHRPSGLGDKGNSRATYIDGLLVKVFTVNEDFLPTEYGLKMPHVPLVDLVKENWEDCSLIQNLEKVLLIPVLKGETLIDGMYLPPVIWRPTSIQMEGLAKEWLLFQRSVSEGKAARIPDGRRHTHRLPTKSDTVFLHMRPAANDGTVIELDSQGNECTRLTLWLNDTAVQKIIKGKPI
jgi:DNA mismatch repair protein MutH